MLSRIALLLLIAPLSFASGWSPVEGNLMTRWAKEVDPTRPWPEYPRPQMVRSKWQNLNGLWQYAITAKDAPAPAAYQGQILVPYPIESALSGLKRTLLPGENLWYQRTFDPPALKRGERLLLHFGAVDFEATVLVNDRKVGGHSGGYQNFSFDITAALKQGRNDLKVKVWDPTEAGPNPHGKQMLKPHGIFYTPSSGIWQTVWTETVPAMAIDSLVLTPDVDHSSLKIIVRSEASEGYSVEAAAGKLRVRGAPREPLTLEIPHARLWSPDDPYLYDLEVRLLKNGKTVDTVRSYFGMRKVEGKQDAQGKRRIHLNDRYTYNLGTLDQGFWPDGLYTAPTDAALKFDVETIKSMGFNTIRKHIKIEPARWYYHCDKLGVMVWQDMVPPAADATGHTSEAARAQFETEVRETLSQLHNHPSITTWVLFNEGWGDYDPVRLERWMKELDPSRLLDGHSGSTVMVRGERVIAVAMAGPASDLADIHSYPAPAVLEDAGRVRVLGEFGGVGVATEGHTWKATEQGWGYIQMAPEALLETYARFIDKLQVLRSESGLDASIYTQPFDVETELNGLITYDREIMKIPREKLFDLHQSLRN